MMDLPGAAQWAKLVMTKHGQFTVEVIDLHNLVYLCLHENTEETEKLLFKKHAYIPYSSWSHLLQGHIATLACLD